MKIQLLAAAAVLVGLAGAAHAHGPTRQKTTESIEINAAPDKVWAVAGDFQKPTWLSAVAKAEGTGGNEKGAKRTLTLQNGAKVEEELSSYDAAGRTYAFRINEVDVKVFPVTNFSSKFTVEDAGGKSKVVWSGAFYRGYPNNDPPAELSDEAALKAVSQFFQTGLADLKKKVEGGS